MDDRISLYLKSCLIIAAIVWGILCLCHGIPISIGQALGYFENIATVIVVLSYFYIRWIWLLNPAETCPRFAKQYKGELISSFEDGKRKEFTLYVSQTLFTINVRIKTDESSSDSITGNLIKGANSWVLFYTYSTNPKASCSSINPMQLGTARFEIEIPPLTYWKKIPYRQKIQHCEGIYWTSQKTIGDIRLWKESNNPSIAEPHGQ